MGRDKIHTPVKEALIDDGWLITDDPLYMKIGNLPFAIETQCIAPLQITG